MIGGMKGQGYCNSKPGIITFNFWFVGFSVYFLIPGADLKGMIMSTKIYNGYKIETVSFVELRKRFEEASTLIKKVKIDRIVKSISSELYSILDNRHSGLEQGEKDPQKVFNNIYWDFRKACLEASKSATRDPFHDLKCEVSVIPLSSKKTLALLYCDSKEYEKEWESIPWVSDYHYQNQTDRPKELTANQWNQRRKDWDLALGKSCIPADHCFTFQLCNGDLPFELYDDDLKKLFWKPPFSFDKRLESLAKFKLREGKKLESFSDYINHEHKIEDMLKTKDGKKEFDNIKHGFRNKIKKVYKFK